MGETLAGLGERYRLVLRVAVHGEETPTELEDAADLVVEGPSGLVRPLRTL